MNVARPSQSAVPVILPYCQKASRIPAPHSSHNANSQLTGGVLMEVPEKELVFNVAYTAFSTFDFDQSRSMPGAKEPSASILLSKANGLAGMSRFGRAAALMRSPQK
jgi:hypothetical protein